MVKQKGGFLPKGEKEMYIKRMVKLIIIIEIFIVVLSCMTTNMNGLPPEMTTKKKDKYTIGPEDVLKIHVWKQADLSITVPVRSDGKISMPLANDIQAAGLTPNQLKDEITKKLTKFVEDPVVSVIVESINSQKVSILGEVNTPGIYKIGSEISLVEALSLAGGLKEFANPKKIKILRNRNGVKKIYQLDYKAIINGKDINQNITLYPGDSVIVPEI